MQGSNFRNLSDPKHGVNVQIAEFNGLFWGIWPDQGSDWNIYGKAARGEVAQILWRLQQKMGGSQTTSTTRPATTTTNPITTTTTRPATTTTTTQFGAVLEASDDFSDASSNNWPNLTGWVDWYYYHYQNGAYAIELQPGDTNWLFCTYNNLDISSGWVEADLKLTDGDLDCGVGLLLRYLDSNNFYLFEIDSAGNYALYRRAAGTWTRLAGWNSSPAINALGTTNHVKFSAFGNALTVVVNNFVVVNLTDSGLTHGSAGFYAEALGSGSVKALIDNLQVWSQFGVL